MPESDARSVSGFFVVALVVDAVVLKILLLLTYKPGSDRADDWVSVLVLCLFQMLMQFSNHALAHFAEAITT